MNEQDKIEVKDLLKQALEERSKEYTSKKKYKIYRKDVKDFFSTKLNKVILPLLSILIIYMAYELNIKEKQKIIEYKNIVVEKIVKEEFDKTSLVFEDLSTNLQNNYILKKKYNKIEKELKQFQKINPLVSKNPDVLSKKIAYLQNNLELVKKNIKKQKFSSVSCYDTKIAAKNISSACKVKLKQFFKENKETSIRFQIIPLLDKKDDLSFKNIKSKSRKEFLKLGLSRARVLEAAWLVKDSLGKDTLISYVNYIAQSKQGRGIIIRAYK